MIPAFPKPSQQKKRLKNPVKVMPDGREICDESTTAGWNEYKRRVKVMWERQGRICGLMISDYCKARGGRLLLEESTFDHEIPRGMGSARRDDRTEVDGKPINSAVCQWCNSEKGSRRIVEFEELIP